MKQHFLMAASMLLGASLLVGAATQIRGSQIMSGTVTSTQLSTTGVTGATYGNASNVGQFTVDAAGRITFAQNVAISGGGGGGAGGGGLVLLESRTASASASLNFTTRNATGQSGATFQSDFDEYVVEIVGLLPATDSVGIQLRFSTDGGSTWAQGAADYRWTFMALGSSGPGNTSSTGATSINLNGFSNYTNTTLRPVNGYFRVFAPLSTTTYKMIGGHITYWDATPTLVTSELVGAYQSATAINALQFFASSGNLTLGAVRIYGVDKTGGSSSGTVVQIKNSFTAAVATGTTTIPFDDTIPQNTEGTEFLTCAITPTSLSNKLRIDVNVFTTVTNTPWIIVALFRDSIADALAVSTTFNNLSTAGATITFSYILDVPSTSAQTYKVRIGPSSAATVTLNGQSGGRMFGGAAVSGITITEYTP